MAEDVGQPLITIGITCYREGEWVQECWDSILAQTDDRWTAVLVMDGGADEVTQAVFARLSHPRLRKFAFTENRGPYPARNLAFEMTETPFHFYVDGDDQLLPDSVAMVLREFAAHPDAQYVYGDYQLFGVREGVLAYPRTVRADDLVMRHCIPGPCAYRKTLWERLGGYPQELARGNGDYDLHLGAAEFGVSGVHCGQPFYRYRTGHASVSRSYERRYHETHEIMVQRHPEFFRHARRRRRFLARAYRRAALENYYAGDNQQAMRLARAALANGRWNDLPLWDMMLRITAPTWLKTFGRQVRKTFGRQAG